MNRTDRLLALVLELQGREWVRAEELARTFEISVRTVYRDRLALNEAGVPVVSVPGQGYRLMDGYFLPPLHFTLQEAVMLAFGADTVHMAFDAEYAGAAQSAAKKLLAALPKERRADLKRVREHLRIIPAGNGCTSETLRLLRSAVLDAREVTFTYHRPAAAPGPRHVQPLGLGHLHGVWLLAAFDLTRTALRTFRLDRMEAVQVTARTFTRDPDWRARYQPEHERRNRTVRVLFPAERQQAVQERASPFQSESCSTPDGYEVTLLVRDPVDVLAWVLSWGADTRVMEPAGLREQVRAEARKMLDHS